MSQSEKPIEAPGDIEKPIEAQPERPIDGEPEIKPPVDERPIPVKDERKFSEYQAAISADREIAREAQEKIAAVKPLVFQMPGDDRSNLAEITKEGVIVVHSTFTPVQAKAFAAWINETIDV